MADTVVETIELGRVYNERRRLFQRRSSAPVVALEAVSFQLKAGRCLALLGPNGAGKSTLLKLLSTITTPTSGRASVAGLDVVANAAEVRAKTGYAGNAERSFFWPLTALENLEFFGQLAGMSRSRARRRTIELLALVGLEEAAGNRLSGYSAGMRQRLALARALLHEPQVLLLDEPTANLDARYREIAIAVINNEVARGTAVIVATHDPGLVSATATDRLHLADGRVVESTGADHAVRYRVVLAPLTAAAKSDVLDVDDLGDGHVLAAALDNAISSGRDVVSVEKQ